MCVQLSLWWSKGKRDDIFWRSATSGGRGTMRSRSKKMTAGGHGDICAVDPIGEPLLDLMSIELKRGYSPNTPYDLLDSYLDAYDNQIWEEWLCQAEREAKESGSYSWAIISKRDRRDPIIAIPSAVAMELPRLPNRYFTYCFFHGKRSILFYRLESFFASVRPADIIAASNRV